MSICKTRPVSVYEYSRKMAHLRTKVLIGDGIFHQFGCAYEEFEAGPGNFTTAIVEMPDGSVVNIPAELIVFK